MGWVMGFEPTASGTTILENMICNDNQGYLLNLTLIQAVYSGVGTIDKGVRVWVYGPGRLDSPHISTGHIGFGVIHLYRVVLRRHDGSAAKSGLELPRLQHELGRGNRIL